MSTPAMYALLGILVTFFATTAGALPALIKSKIQPRTEDILMGFSAGVMLAATCFSLIVPSVKMAQAETGNLMLAGFWVSLTVLFGGIFLHLCNAYVPHEHFVKGREGKVSGVHLKRIWLFIFAIGLHNFPEGLAVGSGMGTLNFNIATPILVGIGLQDFPEGFVVAIALIGVGYSRKQALMVTAITGLVEAIAAFIGYVAIIQIQGILPWALAFCGGSMLYVVSDEIIPESHRSEFSKQATAGLMAGFTLMMFLDIALGNT